MTEIEELNSVINELNSKITRQQCELRGKKKNYG